jgi:predicted permease
LSELLVLFTNNLLPIFLAAGAGLLLSRFLSVNPRSLSQVIFYIFSPCLIFNLITQSQLSNADILTMMVFTAIVSLLVGIFAWLAGRVLRLDRRLLAAVVLTSIFMNSGNFGLSVNQFAFGEQALAFASLYFVASAVLAYTFGVLIASMGKENFGKAFLNLRKVPAVYALVLAFIFLRTGWKLPLPLERTTNLLGDASIPSMLVLLGLQFQTVRWKGQVVPLVLSNFSRILVAPAIAFGLSLALNLQGYARLTGITQSAMPTAVLTTVLATEYDLEPSFVTAAVFMSTLLSSITLTPILALLGN